jgi:tRNA (guanine-N7-)-methyltransferase
MSNAAPSPRETSLILPLDDRDSVLSPHALFGNHHPLEVDVGCGKGRFLSVRAAANPGVSFLGVDRQTGRLEKTARKCRQLGVRNVRLLYSEAGDALSRRLPAVSVSVFYVFFPDPWPKRRHHPRRLVGPAFVEAVWSRLVAGGVIHIATDHADYFERIATAFGADPRFEPVPPLVPTVEERTEFEATFLKAGAPIHRCSFRKLAA